MTFPNTLKLLPLALLLLACESRSDTHTVPTVAAQATATPPPHKPAPARKAMQTFTWQDDVCENTGTFPAGAYTQRQLRDTYQLVNGFQLNTTVVPFQLGHYNDAFFSQAAQHLTQEHDSLAARLHGLQVVPTPYWRNIKRLRELELAEEYVLDHATLEGYFHPDTWLSNAYYAHCAEYATALASTDSAVVIPAWRKLVDAEKVNNGIPASLEAAFKTQLASPERMRYAKVALMTFGWSNCANAQRKYSDLSGQHPLQDDFAKLFTHVAQANCVDVD
ncbi:hypothetical protein GCM10023172_33640 [Hymenobacter ginsengisoli]|uniref:Uncharacterized protein n=1 Tax=Hymenobacter ginsengisoli TaxID=1051626 RepID=A0ABP8QNS5_9BACT|nr:MULTISPECIES: hypothetical protein [unclassified Hymenobacter]MBO2031099.1 hypothetical protein [Hymenobacter sp. BT559]